MSQPLELEKPLTVGQLRRYLADMDADTAVRLVVTENGPVLNVAALELVPGLMGDPPRLVLLGGSSA
jgi:hypothetical protein